MLNMCVYLRTKFQISSKILTSEEFYHIPRSTAKRTPKKPTQIKVMCSQKQLERRKKQIWQLSNFTKVASFIPCNYIQLTTFKWNLDRFRQIYTNFCIFKHIKTYSGIIRHCQGLIRHFQNPV